MRKRPQICFCKNHLKFFRANLKKKKIKKKKNQTSLISLPSKNFDKVDKNKFQFKKFLFSGRLYKTNN